MEKEGDHREAGLWLVSQKEEEEEEARSKSDLIELKITKIRSFTDEDKKGVDGAKDTGIKDDREELQHGDEHQKHACRECGKGFKSGKALGGHKRIHVHENKKLVEKSNMAAPNLELSVVSRSALDGSMGDELEVSCCVCGKKFPSMKALYGHMRFHPDRGWRGVQPPPPRPAGSSSSTLSDDHDDDDHEFSSDDDDQRSEFSEWDSEAVNVTKVVDLKESLTGSWSVTGKRGRRSTLKIEAKAKPEEDLQEAVNDLLMLGNAEFNLKKAQTFDVPETSYYNTHEDEALEQKILKRIKKKRRLSDMEKASNFDHQLDVHSNDVIKKPCEAGSGISEKHLCVTCNKAFPSYQALGGHRASHNKIKNDQNRQSNRGELYPLLAEGANGLANNQGANTWANCNGDHQCNICFKSFPTGQALGGHKRRHWGGQMERAASSSSQATELTNETKLQRVVLNIDLNQPPPEEYEEETV